VPEDNGKRLRLNRLIKKHADTVLLSKYPDTP